MKLKFFFSVLCAISIIHNCGIESGDQKVKTKPKKAAFFDRDNTLIIDVPYRASPDNPIELIPHIAHLARNLQAQGYLLIVITNQSGVARGYFDEQQLQKVNQKIDGFFKKEKINIDAWYYCPHHPQGTIVPYAQECSCRKPQPGMLLKAAKDYNIDLSQSYMFGDSDCDKEAGRAAGCKAWRIDEAEFLELFKEELKGEREKV